ncbi:MAG: stage III sporulation protein AF [Clostridiales bacterium]|jgi:stage III sporulation protein AF|nr:stage III sporulation protein AF [Clostridiales bacterium]
MSQWITVVAVSSIIFAVLEMLLPEGGTKRTALLAFGVIFISVVVTPVFNMVKNGFFTDFVSQMQIKLDRDDLNSDIKNGDEAYIGEVLDKYKDKLSEASLTALKDVNGIHDPEVSFDIVEDPESEDFGKVLFSNCKIYLSEEKTQDSVIQPVDIIDKIEITLSGVKSHNPAEEEKQDALNERQTEAVDAVKKRLAATLGIPEDSINVEIG